MVIDLGEANSVNTKTYHDCRKRLTDHSDYFGAVYNLFSRLPKNSLVDGWGKWSSWQESNFKAYEKNQRDYITKIAKAAILKMRGGEEPEKRKKVDRRKLFGVTPDQHIREIITAEYPLERLEYIVSSLAAEIEKRKVSASEPADDVKTTPAPQATKKSTAKKIRKPLTHAHSLMVGHTRCRQHGKDIVFAEKDEMPTCWRCKKSLEDEAERIRLQEERDKEVAGYKQEMAETYKNAIESLDGHHTARIDDFILTWNDDDLSPVNCHRVGDDTNEDKTFNKPLAAIQHVAEMYCHEAILATVTGPDECDDQTSTSSI